MQLSPGGNSPGVLLHVGCGGSPVPEYLQSYKEVRLDIDERHKPDIIGSMTDLGEIGQYDMVYCCHALEHLYPHDVIKALKEFYRVIKPGGAVMVLVPDLEDVKPTLDVVYESPSGPITGLDMYYGLRSVLEDMPYMAHKTGFFKDTLEQAFKEAGFEKYRAIRGANFNLIGVGGK